MTMIVSTPLFAHCRRDARIYNRSKSSWRLGLLVTLPDLGTNGSTTADRRPTVNSHFRYLVIQGSCVSLLSSNQPLPFVVDMDADHTPPPAYSVNEQEFDQKISQATALSLNVSQASLTIDPDGWPQYDPAAFEAIESSTTSPSTTVRSSSGKMDDYMQHGRTDDRPSVVPLRIEKKNHRKSLPKPPAISQPMNESSSLTIGKNSRPILSSSETSNHDDFRTQHHSAYAEDTAFLMPLTPIQYSTHKRADSLPSIPPPPFESQPPTCIPESGPLLYDHDNHYQQYVDPYNISPSPSARQPRPQLVPQERPAASYSPSPNTIQPSYLDFNPSIAYGRTQPAAPSLSLKQPVKNIQFDPHSFYNSAVSAQIAPITTGQQEHSSYSSYNSRNSLSPQRQYQQQGSSATYLRPGGHYSQSYVSQDSLSIERSSASFEINSSRRPVQQSPARPSSSLSTNYQTFNTPPSAVYQYVDHTANVPGNIYYDQSPEHRWSTQ